MLVTPYERRRQCEGAGAVRVLVLGGTAEARALADRLVALGHDVTSSLAGRTQHPSLPAGRIRVGKFGGIPGLAGYLRSAGIELLVDATHPYAGLISVNAVAAARLTGIPLLRLMRPAWTEPEGAAWVHVPDLAAAAKALPSGACALITTGHEGLDLFAKRDDCSFVVRLIEPPESPLPDHMRLLLARPPHDLAAERALFQREAITHLVTKNSGGPHAAKLEAAWAAGATIVMIDRPAYGPAVEVASVEAAVAAISA
jgi:precorrin-6A/cobalt-precorrin-6A reductase